MKRAGASAIATVVVAAGAVLAYAPSAQACGGFFCSQTPIDQSGEQIIFSLTPNHVTAYIQISYTGAAKDFAWVVPVAAKPEISVGSQAVFQAVGGRTQPSFQLAVGRRRRFVRLLCHSPGAAGGAPARWTTRGVTVLDAKDVGPFSTVTLAAHDSAELLKWLDDNGFQQPAEALPLIDHYVQLHMLFVALRLKQDATAGDIQPIVLDMDDGRAVRAAHPHADRGEARHAGARVRARGRARRSRELVPRRRRRGEDQLVQLRLELPRGRDDGDRRGRGPRLRDRVRRLVGAPEGHHLQARGSSTRASWRASPIPPLLIQALLNQGYPRDATMQALLRKWIPMPAAVAARGVTEQMFYSNVAAYKADLDAAGYVLDINGFIADLADAPHRSAQEGAGDVRRPALPDAPLSTVSPDEMTRDPIFTVNKDLPDVSNNHVAKATGMCQADGSVKGVKLELEDGRVIAMGDVSASIYSNTPWTFGNGSPPRPHRARRPRRRRHPDRAAEVTRIDSRSTR